MRYIKWLLLLCRISSLGLIGMSVGVKPIPNATKAAQIDENMYNNNKVISDRFIRFNCVANIMRYNQSCVCEWVEFQGRSNNIKIEEHNEKSNGAESEPEMDLDCSLICNQMGHSVILLKFLCRSPFPLRFAYFVYPHIWLRVRETRIHT